MTSTGLIMMVASNVIIVLLTLYCFWRVMTSPNAEETEHAPLEIDNPRRRHAEGLRKRVVPYSPWFFRCFHGSVGILRCSASSIAGGLQILPAGELGPEAKSTPAIEP